MGLRLAGVSEGVPDSSSSAAAENRLTYSVPFKLTYIGGQLVGCFLIALSENKRPGNLVKRVRKDLINASKGERVREEELEKRGKDLVEHIYL